MTVGLVSTTRTTTDRHFRLPVVSGVDTNMSDRLRALFEQTMPNDVIPSWDSIMDYQTRVAYGQGDQTSTRDFETETARHMLRVRDVLRVIDIANRGAVRQTYQTEDIHSTTFGVAHAGSTYDVEIWQLHPDIQAIAHMDDKAVINELVVNGLADVAKRLTYLYDVTEEDEEDIKLDSLRGFATLMIKNRDMHLPQITVTDDGLIQAVWKHPRQGTLVMDFQESGDVEFTLLYGRWDQVTKRRRLSGELHPDQAMLHVGHFVCDVMGA